VNESLLLNKEEELLVSNLMQMMWHEFHSQKDPFSIPIVLSHISTLLNLTDRFYTRQFDTRKKLYNKILNNFFDLLKNYYLSTDKVEIKQPSVQFFAKKLNVTPNYLSDIIKYHSGKSALTIIHNFIIEEAKKLLATTNLTISEISYRLGFEYPNYFSKLFKQKTKYSPSEYRKSVKYI
jgi:AraC-like DNA-binding protein